MQDQNGGIIPHPCFDPADGPGSDGPEQTARAQTARSPRTVSINP